MSRAVVWMVLAALAGAAAGCGDDDDGGGGEGGSSKELDQLVAALEDVTTTPTRSQIEMFADTKEDGTFRMTGEMEGVEGEARADILFEQGGDSFQMEILQHEDAAWMRSPAFDGLLPPGKTWIKTTDPEVVGGSTLTPAQFGELLESAGEVDDLGRERVSGVDARHLRAVVGVEDLVKKADQTGAADVITALVDRNVDVPLDVWLGPDGRPVRLHLEIEMERPGGGRPQTVEIDMDEFEYDVPVDTDPPPDSAVTDDSVLQ
jgi:hypothetical protein